MRPGLLLAWEYGPELALSPFTQRELRMSVFTLFTTAEAICTETANGQLIPSRDFGSVSDLGHVLYGYAARA